MNFSDLDGDAENLNLCRDIYILRIKTILASIQEVNFEDFLKDNFKIDIEMSPFELFQNVIVDSILAVEYGIKEKDDELIHLANTLIVKLKSGKGKDISLAKLFAKLLEKTKNLCQAGFSVLTKIGLTFEYMDFAEVFHEKMVKKMIVARKYNSKKFYYSNN